MNTGINPKDWSKEAHAVKDYYVGVSPVGRLSIFPDGHGWGDYLPAPEFQKKKAETMACVSFSHNNCLEMYALYLNLKSLIKRAFNISDRALAKMSNTTSVGNSPNNVCETFRKKGFVWEEDWPFGEDFSWSQFYSYIPSYIAEKATKNRDQYEYVHEWVEITPDNLKTALQYSPIQVIGYAWIKNGELYTDGGHQPNHAFVIYDYKDGEYWLAYDSYTQDFQYDESGNEEFIKKLKWNFSFGDYGKILTIKPKVDNRVTLYSKILNMFKKISRGVDGSLWFLKNGGKQKIESWLDFAGAVIDEIGVENNNLSQSQLNTYKDVKFFGK